MRTFVGVVESRSFSAAARSLGATTSAISKRIAALEAGLGTQLFHRTTRTLSPTEAGQGWDDLVNWVANHHRPAGDNVLKDEVVADANYGCAFSDAAAFNSATPGTRRLFTACPAATAATDTAAA